MEKDADKKKVKMNKKFINEREKKERKFKEKEKKKNIN